MKSFINILQSVGHVIQTGTVDAAKYTSVIAAIPGYGSEAASVLNAIVAIEKLIPTGGGAAKKAAVTAIVGATVPSVPAETLSKLIDEIVTALNALHAALAQIQPAPAAA